MCGLPIQRKSTKLVFNENNESTLSKKGHTKTKSQIMMITAPYKAVQQNCNQTLNNFVT